MAKGVEELRRILERMQKDLDIPAAPRVEVHPLPAASGESKTSAASKEPVTPPPAMRETRGSKFTFRPENKILRPADSGTLTEGEYPLRESLIFSLRESSVGPWERVLLLIWTALALAGVLVDDRMVSALGLLGIIWVVLRTSIIAGMSKKETQGSADVEDLILRVTALEKRVAAIKNHSGGGGSGGPISPKLQEDILELKTIVKALFKALEEPGDTEGDNHENDN